MAVFCHVKKGDKVIVSSGKFKKTIGNVTSVSRLSVNRFAVTIDSIPKISRKKKRSEDVIQKDIFIDSSNVLLLQAGSN
jgi:ribosomal protein L24